MGAMILIDEDEHQPVTMLHGIDADEARGRLAGLNPQHIELMSGNDLVERLVKQHGDTTVHPSVLAFLNWLLTQDDEQQPDADTMTTGDYSRQLDAIFDRGHQLWSDLHSSDITVTPAVSAAIRRAD